MSSISFLPLTTNIVPYLAQCMCAHYTSGVTGLDGRAAFGQVVLSELNREESCSAPELVLVANEGSSGNVKTVTKATVPKDSVTGHLELSVNPPYLC